MPGGHLVAPVEPFRIQGGIAGLPRQGSPLRRAFLGGRRSGCSRGRAGRSRELNREDQRRHLCQPHRSGGAERREPVGTAPGPSIAATRLSPAPTAITCPPENEEPHSAMRSGSTPPSAAGVGDRRPPVVVLAADVDKVPRLARRLAEVAIVEDERSVAGCGEALRERVEPRLLQRAEAVGHDHAGDWPGGVIGPVQPARKRLAARLEANVLARPSRALPAVDPLGPVRSRRR